MGSSENGEAPKSSFLDGIDESQIVRDPVRQREHLMGSDWHRTGGGDNWLGNDPAGETEPPLRPDWSIWKHMRSATADDAIALALGINPIALFASDPFSWELIEREAPEAREQAKRLRAIVDNRFREVSDGLPGWDEEVDLIRFGKLIQSLGEPWSLPPEYPKSINTQDQHGIVVKPGESVEQGLREAEDSPPYLTPKLLRLFDAMRAVKANLGKKPIDIIGEVMGCGRREAGIIASLINDRPDGRQSWRDNQPLRQ